MVSPDSPHGLPRLDGHRRTRLRSWPAYQDGSAGARRGRRLDFFDGRRTGWSRAWDERGTVRAACVHFQQCWRGQAGEGAGRGDGDGRGMANRDRIAGDLSSICGLFSPPAALARASRTSKQTHAWPDRPLRGRAKAELGRNSKQPIGATTPRRPLEARASSPLPHPHVPSPRNRNAPAIVVPPTVFVFVGDYCSTKLVLLPRRQFKRANVATPRCLHVCKIFSPPSFAFGRGGTPTDRLGSSPRPEGSLGTPVVFASWTLVPLLTWSVVSTSPRQAYQSIRHQDPYSCKPQLDLLRSSRRHQCSYRSFINASNLSCYRTAQRC